MRSILFRGKTSIKWVYGDLVQENEPIYIRENKYTAENDYYGYYMIYEHTLGQYTGIDDKNGVKVFEGDIVHAIRLDNTEFVGIVNWDEELACFLILNRQAGIGIEFGMDRDDIEVIGNKFDNPELLEA